MRAISSAASLRRVAHRALILLPAHSAQAMNVSIAQPADQPSVDIIGNQALVPVPPLLVARRAVLAQVARRAELAQAAIARRAEGGVGALLRRRLLLLALTVQEVVRRIRARWDARRGRVLLRHVPVLHGAVHAGRAPVVGTVLGGGEVRGGVGGGSPVVRRGGDGEMLWRRLCRWERRLNLSHADRSRRRRAARAGGGGPM